MALMRMDPAIEVDSLQSEMNRIFDSFFGARGNGTQRRWVPAMDLAETESDLLLSADLPGVAEEDVTVEVKDNVLSISGERKDARERKDRGYHRVERSFGRFSRTLALPDGIDADRIEARFDQGVLEVRIPKPEQRKPHRVAIGSNRGDEPAIEAEGTETT